MSIVGFRKSGFLKPFIYVFQERGIICMKKRLRGCFYNGINDTKDYYMIRGTKEKGEILRLVHYKEDEYIEYHFKKTDKYRATKTKWNDDICRELENDIMQGKVEVVHRKSYKISEDVEFCAYAKHFRDGKEYRWILPISIMYQGLDEGDCIIVDTKAGETLAFVTRIEKLDKSEDRPLRKVIDKFEVNLPFLTREEYRQRMKMKKNSSANKSCDQ